LAKVEVRSPGWLRFVEILSGLGMVLLAIVVLSDPNFVLLTFVYLIAFGLLLWAIATLAVGIFGRLFSPTLRGLSVGSGLIALVVAIVVLFVPDLVIDVLLVLLALVLLIVGVGEIMIGAFAGHRPMWLRGVAIVVGVLTSSLAVLVVFDPALGKLTLTFVLATIIGIVGIRNFVHGITGHRTVHLYGASPATEI
jgi:uncharacterized membrane protein HdeD (DUF308 family)